MATGYLRDFLGIDVRLPMPSDNRAVRLLDYTHFSVLLDTSRRLAIESAVNIDGQVLMDLERGDDWHLDARVPAAEQAGSVIYAHNDLDRGHLTRRRDPVWGDIETATAANFDSFVYTNAAPQAAEFNQSRLLWAGLEDYILDHARAYAQRLLVFTGCIFESSDPVYRGIQIPLRFWKVAAWAVHDVDRRLSLAATGYVLDQSPELGDVDLASALARARLAGDPPPLGAYRTYQVPIVDIDKLTSLDLGQLADADRLVAVDGIQPADEWIELTNFGAITL